MSKWVGYAVSVKCGEPLGCYQGTILDADGTTITLTKAFRNGFPYPKSQVTLNAADIKELKIIEARAEPGGGGGGATEQTHSTVAVAKSKKAARATVCENLQANPSSSGNQANQANQGNTTNTNNSKMGTNSGNNKPTRSKPIDIQGQRNNKNNNHTGSYSQSGSTPKSRETGGGRAGGGGAPDKGRGRHWNQHTRNEACFGELAADCTDPDFDFEGNLALFDKRALWEQMSAHKPDLLPPNYKHTENVIVPAAEKTSVRGRGIAVCGPWRGPVEYVSDEGVVVPSVTSSARRALWEGMARAGLAHTARVLLARAAADVCVRLVGGGRRLEVRNAHQAPTVCVLAAHHHTGAVALIAARLLASHNANVVCYLHPTSEPGCIETNEAESEVQREMSALELSDVSLVENVSALPHAPDLILLALHDPLLGYDPDMYTEVLSWARLSRAGVVSLEPAPEGWEGVTSRAAVLALLPPALAPSLGRVLLADVAPPPRLLRRLGVHYRPPFGAAPFIALHPADD